VYDEEFDKLADRLELKDVKNDEKFIQLLRCNLPSLAEVIPSDIMTYLVSQRVLRFAKCNCCVY